MAQQFDLQQLMQMKQAMLPTAQQNMESAGERLRKRGEMVKQGNTMNQDRMAGLMNDPNIAPGDVMKSLGVFDTTANNFMGAAQQGYDSATGQYNDLLNELISLSGGTGELDQLKMQNQKLKNEQLIKEIERMSDSSSLTGQSAVKEVYNQGGRNFLEKSAGTRQERESLAEAIMQAGGYDEFIKNADLLELTSGKEKEALTSQSDLLGKIQRAIQMFSGGDQAMGTGPLAKFVPGFISGETTREMRRQVENLRADYQKAISGATVSDQEAKRLEAFLPTKGKTEPENLGDLQKLAKDLEINMKIFEIGKRNNLTPNQALKQYGKQIFEQYGVKYPYDAKTGKPDKVDGYIIEKVE
jgi:hypothetical protein